MKMIFVVFGMERNGKFYAVDSTIHTGTNLIAFCKNNQATICHLCESRAQAKEIAAAWNEAYKKNGTSAFEESIALSESDFVRKVKTDVETIAANAPAPYERFSVVKTTRGYNIWDDIRRGIYVNAEGITENFDSECQAATYLEQVKKAVSDKEEADWLFVERAKEGLE